MDFASTALSLMGGFAFLLSFVPYPLRHKLDAFIRDLWEKLFSSADPFAYIEVPRHRTPGSGSNPLYLEVSRYLGTLNVEFATRRVSVCRKDGGNGVGDDAPTFDFGLPYNETVVDTFEGAQLSWKHTQVVSSEGNQPGFPRRQDVDGNCIFTLKMLKSDKQHLLHGYLNHIYRVASHIKRKNALRSLFTNATSGSPNWQHANLTHPSTFDTLALDCDLAQRIQADLKAFSQSESYYHNIGRAWKRGYLLYGPPGTGKSSLIAAIANYLHYDIYYLELTNVHSNATLQNLLMHTTRKSVIVIEDIDCSARSKLSHRQQVRKTRHEYDEWEDECEGASNVQFQSFTLSGLLNFTDGLLSCYGEERIFIFTTNYKEQLDSALLRCGRMDMHVHLSYCTFSMLKKLVISYLGIDSHPLYDELEEVMRPDLKITPATIAEILISERNNPDEAIRQVLAAVKEAGSSNVNDDKLIAGVGAASEQLDIEGPAEKNQPGAASLHAEDLSTMIETTQRCSSNDALQQKPDDIQDAHLKILAAGRDEVLAGACATSNGGNPSAMLERQIHRTNCERCGGKSARVISGMNVLDSDTLVRA